MSKTDEHPLRTLVNPVTGAEFEYAGKWLRGSPATDADIKRGLARFRGDQVWLSFPPGVQAQLDKGSLIVKQDFDAREDVRYGEEAGAVPLPRGNESRERWIGYAISQGMERGEADGLSRDQIRMRFAEPVFDPDAPPALDVADEPLR